MKFLQGAAVLIIPAIEKAVDIHIQCTEYCIQCIIFRVCPAALNIRNRFPGSANDFTHFFLRKALSITRVLNIFS